MFPDTPGVYLFLSKNRKILYIGRATSLKDRVKSYFNKDIAETRGPLIEKMLSEARDTTYIKTDSVLEALILEAHLIKKHQPLYNTKEKSDKSFNYVVITDEDFPRVLLIRGKELILNSKLYTLMASFGPFPHGSLLREALKIVRKIFPFRDTCIPTQHSHILENVRMLLSKNKKEAKPCFNRQIGLCPGVCTGEISKQEYRKRIKNIILLFEGKKHLLIKKLEREMKETARKKEFEKAGEIKRTLFALKHIQDISLIKPTTYNLQPTTYKIEGYDVAHLSGTNSAGVMTVIENGEMQTNEYRKFNIKNEKRGSDTHALAEILDRRLGHNEWSLPKLIVVDGGKAQMNTALRVLNKYGIQIPVVGVLKDEHHRPKNILGPKNLIQTHEKEILLANSEAHRFAIQFHKKKRRIV